MELLEVHPNELKFIFESKKQSSCTIQLINRSTQYVAFKVKTTCPKKYCVRPNTGIVMPNSSIEFTVTMQAQRSAPPDLQCKDKFLIQSTIAPYGASEDDITPNMFAKDSGQVIGENKLKVVLVTPPHSPAQKLTNRMLKQDSSCETLIKKDKVLIECEDFLPPQIAKDLEGFNSPENTQELKPVKDVESKATMLEEEIKLKLVEDIENLKQKLRLLETKLSEADATIKMLSQDRGQAMEEKGNLEQELAMLKKTAGVRRVQVGFPLLYVCMVSLVSLTLGYVFRF